MLYINENYKVIVDETNPGYLIVNTNTGVIEGTTEVLPDALYSALRFNVLLKQFYEREEEKQQEVERQVQTLQELLN